MPQCNQLRDVGLLLKERKGSPKEVERWEGKTCSGSKYESLGQMCTARFELFLPTQFFFRFFLTTQHGFPRRMGNSQFESHSFLGRENSLFHHANQAKDLVDLRPHRKREP